MSTLREQHEAAYRERQELRRGDDFAGPRECCGHEARNHGPKGCAMPGCGYAWPLMRFAVDMPTLSLEAMRAAVHALDEEVTRKGGELVGVSLVALTKPR